MMGGALVLAIGAIFLSYCLMLKTCAVKHAPAINENEKVALLKEAQTHASQGDDDKAIRDYRVIIAKYPDSAEAESTLYALASLYEKRKDYLKAKELYKSVIAKFPSASAIPALQESLDNVNIKILFSDILTPDSFIYEVQKGDTLAKLAKKFGTTMELISTANGLKGDMIRIGQKIKITKARFSIVVDKSQNILTLKSDETMVKTYRVSTGKGYSTPAGKFTITNKIVEPTWYTTGAVISPGSPDNILGSRWMGISKPGYGIHGTTEPQSIGKQVTAGCIRMLNPDIIELYTILPEGTEVVIVD